MTKSKACCIFVLVLVLAFALGRGQTLKPEAEKAMKMVKTALDYWEKNGRDAALKEINARNPLFSDGAYYIFVYDYSKPGTAICIARADGDAAVLGVDKWAAPDSDGKLYIQEMVKIAQSAPGHGWVDYKKSNPVSQKIEPKSSYIEKVYNAPVFIGCGFYR